MEFFTIILLAVGLATDAFAVAVTRGAGSIVFRWKSALKMAALFGLFQSGMPVFGWLAGISFQNYIASVDHWIAFSLLSIIGARMIYHDWRGTESEGDEIGETAADGLWTLLALAVATSIDALVAGISFIVLHSILLPVVSIGVITFGLCSCGAYLGHRYKHLAGSKVNTFGGTVLILIGLKILIEHLQHS
jgi:Predicted membrane protein